MLHIEKYNHEASHYAFFSILRSIPPLDLNIFLSTPPTHALPCMTGSFAPTQTSKQLIILYILIYLLESKWDEKRFWIRWMQTFPEFNLLLVFNLCNLDLLVLFPNKSMSL